MPVKTLNIDLKRVEGDLELEVDVEDGVIVDARCIGTLYRGFEQILVGRAPRDAAVITPRVCGICGTAHLYSAALALEQVWDVTAPPNATRVRNLCLMAEAIQSDIRQTFLFFAIDFCNEAYKDHPLYDELLAAFEPFKGTVHNRVVEHSRKALEIVALFGGQWPHSSYMLPGGVVAEPDRQRIIAAIDILNGLVRFCEEALFGCSMERWHSIETAEDFFAWLDEKPEHAGSAIGLMTRMSRDIGLHKIGIGHQDMLSYGSYCDPETWESSPDSYNMMVKPGFFDGKSGKVTEFDQSKVTEHVRYSWFRNYEGGRHPFEGETIPAYQPDTEEYTWAKAPRYGKKAVQTGPLAELLIDGEPLISSLYALEGGNTWLRQFARLIRVPLTLGLLRDQLDGLAANLNEPFFLPPEPSQQVDGQGFGLVQAARGSLGHWVQIKNGVIDRYQIVTPTAWNASPRDSEGQRGHWEESLIGLSLPDPDNPVEIGHVIRSHDPCLVCTVHIMDTGKKLTYGI